MATTQESAGSATPSSARRTHGSSVARAPTSTTSRSRGCSTWRSSAACSRMPDSTGSTPRERAGARRCRRDRDGRAARAAQPRLDADALGRHAGCARDGQGPLPGSGGRVRHRGERVHRKGRARADRRRLRAASGGHEPAGGEGRRRADDPRREGRAGGQPRLPLGGGRQGRDRPRFAAADKVITLDTFYPRCHPAPLECCGCVADVNPRPGPRRST